MSYAINFDASTVAPSTPFELLPAGWFNVVIVESEAVPTKKAGGEMLKLTMEVMDGPYQGQKIFDRLNLVNENPKAVELAYRTLSAICHATGRIQIQNVAELHGAPMMAKLRISAPTEQYDSGNEVKAYKALDGSPSCSDPRPTAAPKPAAAPAQAPAPQQSWNAGAPQASAPNPGTWAPPAAAAPAAAPQAQQYAPVQQPQQMAPVQQMAPAQAPVQYAPVAQQPQQAPQAPVQYVPAPAQQMAPQMAQQAPAPVQPAPGGWVPPVTAQGAPVPGATPQWAQ